jgi:hypothetical protein
MVVILIEQEYNVKLSENVYVKIIRKNRMKIQEKQKPIFNKYLFNAKK